MVLAFSDTWAAGLIFAYSSITRAASLGALEIAAEHVLRRSPAHLLRSITFAKGSLCVSRLSRRRDAARATFYFFKRMPEGFQLNGNGLV